ncbi:hypothetical protein [uncultured Marinobacter sp.]|uniref:hypothetical protein n=1 Tax=uncultured Marinobacter sp. TaxID=187379 RepID=UPI00261D31DB|nr:hypothetical protein [uncultured Marinobacter sp.]
MDTQAKRKLAGILKLLILIALIVVGNLFTRGVLEGMEVSIRPSNEPMLHRIIVTSMIAYVFLMAIPFVPGVEIGLALMMLLGPKIVPLVYGCTLVSLCLGFMVGRFLSEAMISRFLMDLHLFRAGRFIERLQGLDSQQRLSLMLEKSPRRLVPVLLRHRFLTLMVVINLPGNMIIGGGGGLAMVAGISRLFSIPQFVLLIAVAISPLPLLLLLFGDMVGGWPV